MMRLPVKLLAVICAASVSSVSFAAAKASAQKAAPKPAAKAVAAPKPAKPAPAKPAAAKPAKPAKPAPAAKPAVAAKPAAPAKPAVAKENQAPVVSRGWSKIYLGVLPSVSPDGKFFVFAWMGRIWKAPVAGGTAISLDDGKSVNGCPFVAPDGKIGRAHV